ncbi:unnamed protein product [Nesidiocoris tenuis]|uniref:RING-type E3 ubiquitin transferase n=1 Tax=Nesidiocoris tenuis TaxID=355587 RepID=A0A6H5HK18_9HEMI|nr:unnamed protein product [Nesidiocoris tenuis]
MALLTNAKISLTIGLCLLGMFGYVFNSKKQFYPTVVYMSKSGAAITICYAEGIFLALMLSGLLRKIFFGELRPIESERLADNLWYALTETCLAFTIFRGESGPGFAFLFIVLIFMKTFHWLTDERVDLAERSLVVSKLYHTRMICALMALSAIDSSFILYSIQHTMKHGPSVQIVLGFEYSILFIMLMENFIKYVMYLHGLFEMSTVECRTILQMYVAVVMSSLKVVLYCIFFVLMVQIFTFPLFVLRPMYFTLKAFKKCVSNVLQSRRALKYLNELYPNATEADLGAPDPCIICREELSMESKKLPCNHVFHTACLRAWFQRQQKCPVCRFSILTNPARPTPATMNVAVQTEPAGDIPITSCCCRSRHALSDLHGTPQPPDLDPQSVRQLLDAEMEKIRKKLQTVSDMICMFDAVTESAQPMAEVDRCAQESGLVTDNCKSDKSENLEK